MFLKRIRAVCSQEVVLNDIVRNQIDTYLPTYHVDELQMGKWHKP